MMIVAIDGSCKHPGKPECFSTSSVFIEKDGDTQLILQYDEPSSSQRGEVIAMLLGIRKAEPGAVIVSDSEYVINTINREWYKNWQRNGWKSAAGNDVKHQDLWMKIAEELANKHDLAFFHIKSHFISMGIKTAEKTLELFSDGSILYKEALLKAAEIDFTDLNEAFQLIHGILPPQSTMEKFVAANAVADITAKIHANKIQSER